MSVKSKFLTLNIKVLHLLFLKVSCKNVKTEHLHLPVCLSKIKVQDTVVVIIYM